MRARFPIALTVAVILAIVYAWAQSWADILVLVTDYATVVVSGVCSLFGLLVILKLGFRGKFGLVHLGLFLAVFLWFLGETAWAIYEVVFNIPVPYPSLADVFYLAGYFPAAIGILQFISFFRKALNELKAIIATISGLMILGLSYVYLLNPLLTTNSGYLTKSFDLAYPALDAMLLILATAMFFVLEQGLLATPWIWIWLGLVLTAIADIAFSLGTLQGWYYSGHPIELLWLWGYVSIAVGFDAQRTSMSSPPK